MSDRPTECVHLRLPRLQKGHTHTDETKHLQRMLNDVLRGEDLEVTGGYGGGTQAAVERFQREQGLTGNAIVGEETWAALLKRWLSMPS